MKGQHAVMLQRLLTAQRAQAATIKTIRTVQVHLKRVHHADLKQSQASKRVVCICIARHYIKTKVSGARRTVPKT